MLPPDEVARRQALIEEQTREAENPHFPEDEIIAKGKRELRAFLTEMPHGATLLRRICFGERIEGATVTEWGLIRLGSQGVWDTCMGWALEPDPVPDDGKTWEHEP